MKRKALPLSAGEFGSELELVWSFEVALEDCERSGATECIVKTKDLRFLLRLARPAASPTKKYE